MDKSMYGKVLIPLDGSDQAEQVLGLVREDLSTDSQVILLKVISPSMTQVVMGFISPNDPVEETDASNEALRYLRSVVCRLGGDPDRWDQWRCSVEVSDNPSHCILEFANREKVDLIAMSDLYGGGFARYFWRGPASEVQRRALMDVKIFSLP